MKTINIKIFSINKYIYKTNIKQIKKQRSKNLNAFINGTKYKIFHIVLMYSINSEKEYH